jgi:hypothetical protein
LATERGIGLPSLLDTGPGPCDNLPELPEGPQGPGPWGRPEGCLPERTSTMATSLAALALTMTSFLSPADPPAKQAELSLNLYREHFVAILDGTKKIEYREKTAFWDRRLKGKNYTHIRFGNGYAKAVPEMVVELKEIVEKKDKYELHLGKIVEKRNIELLSKK